MEESSQFASLTIGVRIILILCSLILTSCTSHKVSIESPVDVGHPYNATIDGYLRLPKAESGLLPAVVLMHGCAGLSDGARQGLNNHANYLVSRGFATLIVDSFTARGKQGGILCSSQSELAAARYYRQFDAFNALLFLKAQTFVDQQNIFLMGQSNGGSVALSVASGAYPVQFPSSPRFRGVVAYYPWCGALPVWPRKLISPLLVFGAGRDDWVRPDYCVSAKPQVSGAPYEVIVYDDAYHSFDLPIPEQYYAGHKIGGNPDATEDSREKMVNWFLEHRR